jgi:GNAT superfamily N-acetyltransferase
VEDCRVSLSLAARNRLAANRGVPVFDSPDLVEPYDWLCMGRTCWRASLPRRAVGAGLGLARAVLPARTRGQRWIRYYVDLAHTPPAPSGVQLTLMTDEIMDLVAAHADRAENQVLSALKFWDRGLRHAFIWMERGVPLCMQWLLTRADGPRLRALVDWAGMYPPLPPGYGQVENLFAFSSAREKGVATRFEYALYHEARRIGLRRLVTHIHEANTAARGWADRTGWRRYGTITRYQIDVPGLRAWSAYLHRHDAPAPAGAASP